MTAARLARHVAVEGVIGVGKTTLAVRLAAHFGAEPVLERPEDNPFLERFYRDGAGCALQAQLHFLFQRADQLLPAPARPDARASAPRVSDYLFDKDRLFARLNLGDDEYRLYARVHALIAPRVPAPGLVVWLRAPTPVLLERIRQRGIRMEQRIAADYLERLADAYAAHFAAYHAAPVLAFDTRCFHPAASDADFAELLRCMEAACGDAPRRPGGAGTGPSPPAG